MSNLTDFLKWLTGADGGAFILVAWAISWGLSGVKGWEALATRTKQLIILGAASALGLLGTWLRSSPETVALIDPYFTTVMYIVMAWLTTQVVHKVDTIVKAVKLGGSPALGQRILPTRIDPSAPTDMTPRG